MSLKPVSIISITELPSKAENSISKADYVKMVSNSSREITVLIIDDTANRIESSNGMCVRKMRKTRSH